MFMSTDDSDARSVDDALLAAAQSPDWSTRCKAVRILAQSLDDPRAVAQLTRSLNDSDTAVVEEATEVLATSGGLGGLREVLRQLSTGEDDVGYHIRDRLINMWFQGFPLISDLARIRDGDADAGIRDAAGQLIAELSDNSDAR
jgi:HEAT repeat protein